MRGMFRLPFSSDFYPRPPRGGRPDSLDIAVSGGDFYPRPPRGGRPERDRKQSEIIKISIHALREEGDTQAIVAARKIERFLSTPSARRATIWPIMLVAVASFLSTPSARRATCEAFFLRRQLCISIHALREEGDSGWKPRPPLRCNFYPRPPRGGRPPAGVLARWSIRFLSTPSARRATYFHLPIAI